MGFFGKKEVCAICGGKLPMAGATQIANGKICPRCKERTTQYISIPQMFTAEEIQQNMQDAEENKKLYTVFTPQEFPYALQVDYQNKLLAVATKKYLKLQKGYIFHFEEIVDYSVEQDGNTIQKSGAGSAVIGGLLFGGVGLVAGGLMGRKSKETIMKLSITLKTTNKWAPTVVIPIVSSEIKKGSLTYNLVKTSTEKILQVLDTIVQK